MNAFDIYNIWKEKVTDPSLRSELESIDGNENEIVARFTAPMSFGTAGLRSIMGAGISRMNIYTVAQATQGLAELIRQENAADKGVAIAHDSRNNSRLFAEISARVLAANGITVYLFDSLRPTPELSFAILELGCISGINITASHNPKEYNGYKVYWSDGAQLPPEHAAVVCEKIAGCDMFSVPMAELSDKHIHVIGSEIDEKYIDAVLGCVIDRDALKKFGNSLNLVYTPLHGTGYRLVPEAMRRAGISNLTVIPEQAVPDGNFPTVVSPNPENPEGFYLAIDLAKKNDVDFILGTDPDSDRVGIMVRNKQGEFEPVTGNQTGVLLLDYLIGAMKRAGKLPANAAALKTIVTTEMARAVAKANGLDCYDTFTGFKFMAEKMNELEGAGKNTVIFSYEESYGYMIGHYVRDKDAVTASLLLTEMAAWYYSQGMTLFDALNALFEKYGWYGEKTHNLVMPGLDGAEKMAALMKSLRETPPSEIAGVKVATYKDYSDGTARDAASGEVTKIALSGSNVLRFELCDGTHIVVRPSGTEPKIKAYILTKGADAQERDANLAKYSAWVNTLA